MHCCILNSGHLALTDDDMSLRVHSSIVFSGRQKWNWWNVTCVCGGAVNFWLWWTKESLSFAWLAFGAEGNLASVLFSLTWLQCYKDGYIFSEIQSLFICLMLLFFPSVCSFFISTLLSYNQSDRLLYLSVFWESQVDTDIWITWKSCQVFTMCLILGEYNSSVAVLSISY